jgi:DNA-binding NtrC family response regulator
LQSFFGTGNKGIYQNGRNKGFKSDFRLIAATNRNLEEEIKQVTSEKIFISD